MRHAFVSLLLALLLSSCAAPRTSTPQAAAPHAIELQEERAISTMHFASGIYSLDQADESGFYYRAPQGVIQHSFGGFVRHDGGIFLARDLHHLRGYVVWGGGRTKIGDLTSAYHVFR